MNWLDLLFGRKSDPAEGDKYRVANLLYSEDARRCVEVRRFASGKAYIVERDLGDDGDYVDRHGGAMVGPFESTKRAELFIIGTPWFRGDESGTT
ncbi:MAG: hypothetical protein V4707_10365 [Pseudomonadota bacterium]